MRRGALVWIGLVGCWTTPDPIDGTFTPAQWIALQQQLALPPPPSPCVRITGSCDAAMMLGQLLFSDIALSAAPMRPPTVSCASCHDASHYFIDTRTPSNVSQGATKFTKRNSIGLVNIAYKDLLAPAGRHDVFTWSGQYATPEDVVDLAVTKAMASSHDTVAQVVRNAYGQPYAQAFGTPVPSDNEDTYKHAALALGAYMRRQMLADTPFDRHLQRGDDTAIGDDAKRGFAVFVGRGMCIECHSGPLFTDFQFHDTGVPQRGDHVVASDPGRADITMNADDLGRFATPSLRNVAMTAPYMHDGALATLDEVIAFYRGGGEATGYAGTRDPRIVPIDLGDDDARDLVAFLRALTAPASGSGGGGSAGCQINGHSGLVCGGTCVDPSDDRFNCGGCSHACSSFEVCGGGMCQPGPLMCPMPLSPCGSPAMCFDLQQDPAHCGNCTNRCAAGQRCAMGTCGP